MQNQMDSKGYKFYSISKCNMCGSPASEHKLMGQRINQSTGLRPKKKSGITVSVFQCKKCKLIFSNPQPVPNDIQDHYGIPPETYWKTDLFTWDEKYFSAEIEKFKSLMPIKSGMKSLDVGAGLGRIMLSMKNAGLDAYGVEASRPFYERAIEKMGIDASKLKFGMLEDVEYGSEEFDLITFGAVLEHLYSPSESIKKALKWLKPGGLIHIEVPSSRYYFSKILNFYYKLRGTSYVTNISPMHSPYHLYEFDVKSFEELGKNLGFSIAKKDIYVGKTIFFPSIIRYALDKYMKMTDKGMMLVIWLKKT